MKITAEEFLNLPKKSITLIGMSGAGKTHISCMLEKWGWQNYSCDYVIGEKYLKDQLSHTQNMSAEDISALSEFLGILGGERYGGFPLALFQERQKAYYDAECHALEAMGDEMDAQDKHFVHDSTGSFCEIEDEALVEKIGQQTLFVYLKTGEKEEREVLQRARDYPKPLFFPPKFLSEKLEQYLSENNLDSIDDIEPDAFSRWVFPILFKARKPKYQRLADLYGVAIPASEFTNLSSDEDFISIIAKHLD